MERLNLPGDLADVPVPGPPLDHGGEDGRSASLIRAATARSKSPATGATASSAAAAASRAWVTSATVASAMFAKRRSGSLGIAQPFQHRVIKERTWTPLLASSAVASSMCRCR